MSTSVMTPVLRKEIRALLPLWAACAAAVTLAVTVGKGTPFGLVAYAVSALVLGSASMGQEFSSRTLPLLLSQPITRRNLFWIKAAALVPMLLILGAMATLNFIIQFDGPRPLAVLLVFAMPLAGGVMLAPWLTMVCRSSLAGVVFGFSLPAALFVVSMWLMPWPGVQLRLWLALLATLCAAAGVLGWRRFLRLEAIDSPVTALELPAWSRWRTPRPGHPLWMLLLKELHLQQLTFALAVVLAVIWLALVGLDPATRPGGRIAADLLVPLYIVLLAVIAGATASAEERQYGTLESQQLLPIPAWHQWMVKIAVAFGPALALTIWPRSLEKVLLAVALAAGSLYISSLSTTTLRAAVVSVAILPITLVFYLSILKGGLMQGTILVALLLRFAFTNHTAAERGFERVARQLAVLFAVLGVSMLTRALAWLAP
jgi:hypothetical protein